MFRGPGEPLSIERVPDPSPEPGDLVLRVQGCGICGSDLHMSEQRMPPGMVMGHEYAGEVVEVGPEAAAGGWRTGERVCALPLAGCGRCVHCHAGNVHFCQAARSFGLGQAAGGYAEYVLAGAAESFRLPEALDGVQGALVEPLAVGLHIVGAARLRAGDNVLVIGAGPVGVAATLWARHFGAREIGVSDPVAGRRELAGRQGATFEIDPGSQEVLPAFEARAGGPPSVILECVGVPGMIQAAFDAAPPQGRVVIAGVCIERDSILPLGAVAKELSVRFAAYYNKTDFAYALDMLASGRVDPSGLITDVIGLAELPAAFESLRRPTSQCKVVVDPCRG
ncbi:MAG: alcohol dehydrogenase catalytic domain-containing protein [Proteobacteria bacterium]|nr:alcohol dehydrogenase catalytic domain-containing protein [Pseudomonadota bacterium]